MNASAQLLDELSESPDLASQVVLLAGAVMQVLDVLEGGAHLMPDEEVLPPADFNTNPNVEVETSDNDAPETPKIGVVQSKLASSVAGQTRDSRTLDIPGANEVVCLRRARLGTQLQLPETTDQPGQPTHGDFVRGGGVWIYEYAREFCLALPDELKRRIIEDIGEIDAAYGQLAGADLLKQQSQHPDV